MSIKYNNLVYEMKGKGADVIVLSLGEAFFDIPLYPFDDLPFPGGYHYSHSRGIPDLRRHLAEYYRAHYQVPVDFEKEIIVTAGSKVAIHMTLMAVLNPGDEVLILEPAWVSYPEQVKLCHGVPVAVPQDRSVWDLEPYVTPRTKAIVVNYPHNPRGQMLGRQEWEFVHRLARDRDLYLISDEAYSEFVAGDEQFLSCAVFDPEKRHTIVCNSISKNFGMSGWRIGYVMTNPELTFEILKINQHLITCPATILQHYVAKHFYEILKITRPQIEEVVRIRREVAAYMDSLGITYLPGSATFYLFVSIEHSQLTSEEFCMRLLNERHVSAVPGLGYGKSCDKFIRVAVGTESMERLQQGVRMIKELIDHTR